MKRCPYCGVENHDTAAVCYNCGRDLSAVQPTNASPEPTQPRRVTRPGQPGAGSQTYPPSPYDTQPLPPYNPPTGPQASYPQQNYPPQGANEPGYYPPASNQPPTYARASYPPPPPPPSARKSRGNCSWMALGGVLGVILLCVLGLALLSLSGAASGIGARLRGQLATQVVDTFNLATPTPQATSPFAEESPTPWPTFTAGPALPTETAPTATPDATQQAYINKVLSPGCKAALDSLGQESNTVTQNPLKLLDDTWRTSFNQAIAAMKTNCGTLDAASPVPGQVSKLNQSITSANSQFDQANQLWTEAVNNRDPSKAIQAAQHIGSAAQYLSQALSEIKTLAP